MALFPKIKGLIIFHHVPYSRKVYSVISCTANYLTCLFIFFNKFQYIIMRFTCLLYGYVKGQHFERRVNYF